MPKCLPFALLREALLAILLLPLVAAAQTYPSKPVKIVVPAGAGGPGDLLARMLGERLSREWHQPVLVDNRPGASSMIGADAVAKSAPDGYTLLLTNDGPITINPALFPKMPYDPVRDLVPVARVVTLPLILVVNPSVPANNVAELIAIAKAQPGKLNYGAGGSTTRMAAELLRTMTGTSLAYIPYKGSAPMVNALVGGEIQIAFDGISSSMPQIKGGRLRALAVTSLARVPGLPDIPTVAESGVPGYESGTWLGLFAPAGVPAEVQQKLLADLRHVTSQPDMKQRLGEMGMAPDIAGPAPFAATVQAETAKWGDLIRRSGITSDN